MDVKQFLDQSEIKALMTKGDLEAVYRIYNKEDSNWTANDLTDYLLDLKINPINYFKKSIPAEAFLGCWIPTKKMIIPNGITSIGGGAFFHCQNLKHIIIPQSVKRIAKEAFAFSEDLTNITYTGTKAQWEEIKKHHSWYQECYVEKVHCTDGNVILPFIEAPDYY